MAQTLGRGRLSGGGGGGNVMSIAGCLGSGDKLPGPGFVGCVGGACGTEGSGEAGIGAGSQNQSPGGQSVGAAAAVPVPSRRATQNRGHLDLVFTASPPWF